LDVGCGTGTLAIAAKRRVGPAGRVDGIDASPEVIVRARKKAKMAGVEVTFKNAVVEKLPFTDGTFPGFLTSSAVNRMLLTKAKKRSSLGVEPRCKTQDQ
jgi:ubiquinone/menaquinone biosynthesis C-methylase UbiE